MTLSDPLLGEWLVPLQVLHELHGRVGAVPFLSIEAGSLETERALQLVCPVMGHLEVFHHIAVLRRPGWL